MIVLSILSDTTVPVKILLLVFSISIFPPYYCAFLSSRTVNIRAIVLRIFLNSLGLSKILISKLSSLISISTLSPIWRILFSNWIYWSLPLHLNWDVNVVSSLIITLLSNHRWGDSNIRENIDSEVGNTYYISVYEDEKTIKINNLLTKPDVNKQLTSLQIGDKISCYLIENDKIYNLVEMKKGDNYILSLERYSEIYRDNGIGIMVYMPILFLVTAVLATNFLPHIPQ